jgi:uncharacterized protein (DUF983 family)
MTHHIHPSALTALDPAVPERPVKRAMLRGWRRRCPQCGAGQMMDGYLKVSDTCTVCSEALHHHRADDGPPYLTILIVCHIIGPLMLWFFQAFRPEPLVLVSIFCVGGVALCLYLLPRLKGVIVGIQWANRMHGFGRTES